MTEMGKGFVGGKTKEKTLDVKTTFFLIVSLVMIALLSGCFVFLMQMREDFKTALEGAAHRDEYLANKLDDIRTPGILELLKRQKRDLQLVVEKSEPSFLEELEIKQEVIESVLEKCAMGMENYGIRNDQIKASSDYTASFNGRYGRLDGTANDVYYVGNSYGAWLPTGKKKALKKEWLQVDLKSSQLVAGIVTQGRPKHYDQWVTSYKISCGGSLETMKMITDQNGEEEIFKGNSDRNSKVINMFPTPMKCRFLRFHPLTWHGTVALRMELVKGNCVDLKQTVRSWAKAACGYSDQISAAIVDTEPPKHPKELVDAAVATCAMGMAYFDIQEPQINTSSDFSPYANGRYGRLDAASTDFYYWGSLAAWVPSNQPYDEEWMQINLYRHTRVSAIVTQGRPEDHDQWVTSFKISCGNSTDKLEMIKDKDGKDKIFQGNRDRHTKVMNVFPQEATCKFVRFHPVTWHEAVGLRMELIRGNCDVVKYASGGRCENSALGETDLKSCVTQKELYDQFLESRQLMDKLVSKCGMGMKDGRIESDQINATSDYTPYFHGRDGRLDAWTANLYFLGQTYGCWMPTGRPVDEQWLEVDFLEPKSVAGIITQGRPKHYDQWIATFKISCGKLRDEMEMIKDSDGNDKIFKGNTDRASKVVNLFPEEITCRYIRVHPQTAHGTPALRIELLAGGCVGEEFSPLLE